MTGMHVTNKLRPDELQQIPLILVCDVGGGTTDLSLIEASFNSNNGDDQELALDRIGVGEHLMLGGDNLDLALAHLAEQRFNQNKKLNASSLNQAYSTDSRRKREPAFC